MTNLWHDVNRLTSKEFKVVVEIPKGSRVKYELDKSTGLIRFDRVLFSAMHYPGDYGFIPQTLWEDGDPIDVLLLTKEPLVPGCLVKCRAVGVLDMIDGGEGDAKVLGVPISDPRFNHIHDLKDVNPHLLKEIKHFFAVYKDLQDKVVEVGDWRDKSEAIRDIEKSFKLYDEKFSKSNPKKA